MTPNIELNIEELILHGFSRNDAFYIGQAVEEELTRLIAIEGLLGEFSQDTVFKSLEGRSFDFTASSRPETIGRQIAQSIYESISVQKQST